MPTDSTTETDRLRQPATVLSPQEETLLAILDGADPFTEGGAPGADRDDLETLGLLARALVPTAVGAASGSSSSGGSSGKAALFRRLKLSSEAEIDSGSASETAGQGSEVVLPFRSPVSEKPSKRSSWVPVALAATVLMAVGLGAWGGFLVSELRQSRSLVAGLESELDRLEQEGPRVGDYQQVLFENRQLRQQIGMATKPKTKVCALSAMAPDQPEARGTVFLRPDEGRWMIATNNLAKCELGRRYRLWFLGKNGHVMGGQVLDQITGAQQIEIASGDLPEETAAVLITLEFPDKFGDHPGGEKVLYGDRSVEIY